MSTEQFGQLRILIILFMPAGWLMQSPLQHWLMPRKKALSGEARSAVNAVLEAGCSIGIFTLSASEMIGEGGQFISLEPQAIFVIIVAKNTGSRFELAGDDNAINY